MLSKRLETTNDEVLQAVRQTKDRLAAALDYDVSRILNDARQKQSQGGRRVLPAPNTKKSVRPLSVGANP